MNEAGARVLLRAILDATCGLVGQYVDLAEAVSAARLDQNQAVQVLRELAERGWVYLRGPCVSVSRPAVEFAMDWPRARQVLHAILEANQGRVLGSVEEEKVFAVSNLPVGETNRLLNQLGLLRLVSRSVCEGTHVPHVSLMGPAFEYLHTGQLPQPPWWSQEQ